MAKFYLDNLRIERRPITGGDAVVINLPRPPSLNGNERSNAHGGRYSTASYKNWKEAALKAIMVQRPHRFTGPVRISILVEETSRISDIDNRIKPCLDALQAAEIIPNDNQKFVRGVSADWSTEICGAQVTITEARAA